MNCKPGDLARITGLHAALAAANDRFVRLTEAPAFLYRGVWHWRLTERVDVVLLGNGRTPDGKQMWIGEPVWFDTIPDKYLRPIRDPGEDAVDEILQKVGLPTFPLERQEA